MAGDLMYISGDADDPSPARRLAVRRAAEQAWDRWGKSLPVRAADTVAVHNMSDVYLVRANGSVLIYAEPSCGKAPRSPTS